MCKDEAFSKLSEAKTIANCRSARRLEEGGQTVVGQVRMYSADVAVRAVHRTDGPYAPEGSCRLPQQVGESCYVGPEFSSCLFASRGYVMFSNDPLPAWPSPVPFLVVLVLVFG